MLRSFHDHYLVAYKVHCERRTIKLYVRHYDRPMEIGVHTHTVVFEGVEGYHFKDDAFGNIIFSLRQVSIEELLSEYLPEIVESNRIAGAPGRWADDLANDPASGPKLLAPKGVKGFSSRPRTACLAGCLPRRDSCQLARRQPNELSEQC